MTPSEQSSPKRSTPKRISTFDLIDARCDAETIAKETPGNWRKLAGDIEKALQQEDGVIDPDHAKIDAARCCAAKMLQTENASNELIKHFAGLIQSVLSEVINSRS